METSQAIQIVEILHEFMAHVANYTLAQHGVIGQYPESFKPKIDETKKRLVELLVNK